MKIVEDGTTVAFVVFGWFPTDLEFFNCVLRILSILRDEDLKYGKKEAIQSAISSNKESFDYKVLDNQLHNQPHRSPVSPFGRSGVVYKLSWPVD